MIDHSFFTKQLISDILRFLGINEIATRKDVLKLKIGVLVGSLREGSFTKVLAQAVMSRLPEDVTAEFVDISKLPFYNEDFDVEGKVPEEVKKFREVVAKFDAFVFATPEYNRSTTPVLKNALDIGSRPYGQSVWSKKPAAVISASPGAIGGFGANHHLRQAISFLDMPMMNQPEVYFSAVHEKFDEKGQPIDSNAEDFIQLIADSIAAHARSNRQK